MNRLLQRLSSALFSLFLATFSVSLLFFDAPDVIAEERRLAAKPAAFSYEAVRSGEFLQKSEAYLMDSLPFRRKLFALHTKIFTRVLKNPSVHGIREGAFGLEKEPAFYEEALVSDNFSCLEGLLARHFPDKTALFALIPHKGYYTNSRDDYDRAWKNASEEARLTPIAIADTLTARDYFYGDIHVRPECYGALAERLCQNLGILPTPFLSSARIFWAMGTLALQFPSDREDGFHALYDRNGVVAGCRVTANGTERPFYDEGAFDRDPYDLYLGGEVGGAVMRIENPAAKEVRRLVVFRDSFARALIPYLVSGYSEILLIDMRAPHVLREAALKDYAPMTDDVLILVSTHTLFGTRY